MGSAAEPSLDLGAREGLERAQAEFGVGGHVLASRTAEEYRRNLAKLARQGHDLVIAVGRRRAGAVTAVAEQFRRVQFAIVDTAGADLAGAPANVSGLLFEEEEAGYLAGYLAGLVTKNESGSGPVIGSVGGRKIAWVDRYVAGFRAGARAANPELTMLNAYADDFVDQAECKERALEQIARGADVVFQVAGRCGLGALAAAGERNVRGIGSDVDQSYLGGHVLTSAVKRVDVAVYQTVQALQEGSFQAGEDIVFDTASGGVGLGDIAVDVPADIVSRVNRIRDRIAAGVIVGIPESVR